MRLLPLTTLLALACNSPTAIAPGQPFVMAVDDTVTVRCSFSGDAPHLCGSAGASG